MGFKCFGTERKDRLAGTTGSEFIIGEGGRDVLLVNGGNYFADPFPPPEWRAHWAELMETG